MADYIAQFSDAIRAAGLTSPDRIEADGKLHRFASDGKRGDDSGWFVLYGDGIPAGAFGSWRSGLSQTWRADIGRSLTPAEEAAYRARVDAMRSEREAETTRRQSAARESAAMTWKEATPVGDHTYLKAKAIKAHRVRFRNGALVVPMKDCFGVLQSLQFIGPEGEKLFLPGGQVTGCYYAIGKPDSVLVIAEGFATGATIHEATGRTVAVAFSANNLEPVARALRGKYPDAHIVVAGDNDASGTGQRSAAEAARAVGGAVAIPPQAGTDWNDVRRESGNDVVKSAIEAVLLVENKEICTASLPAGEVRAIAKDAPGTDEFASVRTAGYVMTATTGPARFCVGNRVPQGLVIIGGRPKSRKSWWALQLAIAKSSGGRFMGMMVTPCHVLYVALEDNDRRMRQRLEFFGFTPQSAPENLHITYGWPTGLQGIEKIERWLAQHPDTKLIIVDVLQRFRGARDARAGLYEGDYQIMALLHGVTQRHADLTIVVVHHVRKGAVDDPVEALNGTFAIAGGADAYIILRRGGEKDQWIAHVDGRDWESWDHEFVWEFVPQEGWRQIGVSDGGTLTDIQREIVTCSKAAGHMTPTKLAEVRGITKQSAGEALRGLVAKGAMRLWSGRYYVNGE